MFGAQGYIKDIWVWGYSKDVKVIQLQKVPKIFFFFSTFRTYGPLAPRRRLPPQIWRIRILGALGPLHLI